MSPPSDPPAIMALLVMVLIGHSTLPFRMHIASRLVPLATQRMLTNQLRELESDALIRRQVFAEVPPKVEYSLTSVGKTLAPVLQSLCDWGKARIAFKNKA